MSETNSQRLRRLRIEAAAKGFCGVCRFRKPKKGCKTCKVCLDRSRDYGKSNVAAGLCACGRPRKGRFKSCERCLRKQSKRSKAQRFIAEIIGLCQKCKTRKPKKGNVTCSVCISQIADAGKRRASANKKAGLCRCGRKRKRGCELCHRCTLYFALRRVHLKEARP